MSTSFVERQNLTMRMAIRRFTRLINAFSKKLDNLKAACALHFAYYNFSVLALNRLLGLSQWRPLERFRGARGCSGKLVRITMQVPVGFISAAEP
jgi:hypothetical protein